jgi:hypothetical protein
LAPFTPDTATVATRFTLSNGVFVRVFALAPAPAVFAGIAAVLFGSRVLARGFAWTALAVAALFELEASPRFFDCRLDPGHSHVDRSGTVDHRGRRGPWCGRTLCYDPHRETINQD